MKGLAVAWRGVAKLNVVALLAMTLVDGEARIASEAKQSIPRHEA
jgi:hypothetical protein